MPLPTLQCPWTHNAVDVLTDLLVSQRQNTILVICDNFSHFIVPLLGLPTAFEIAELLFNHVFRNFVIPEDIVSDRGVQFNSQV